MFAYSHTEAFLAEPATAVSVLPGRTGFDLRPRTANVRVLAGRHAR